MVMRVEHLVHYPHKLQSNAWCARRGRVGVGGHLLDYIGIPQTNYCHSKNLAGIPSGIPSDFYQGKL